ncbi:MAG: hypothetical protein ACI9FN_004043 [Saprospiraceae bacterium]|jgi:hypothetical protein
MNCFGLLQGQIDDCFYNRTVSGTPSVDVSFLAEYKLTSSHKIDTPLPIHYGAGFEICLDTGFYINTGTSLTANLEGCVAQCLPVSNVCDESCISPLEGSTTNKGQRYVKFEVVLTFPDSFDNIVPTNCGTGSNYSNCLFINGIIYNIADTLLKYFPVISSTAQNQGELKRCLCDRNIFLYTNDNLIFEEGGIAQRNRSSGGITEEGGVFSLNYILAHFEPQNPDSIVMQNVSFKDRGHTNRDPNATIVAILDSGLDPEFVPFNSLYYDPSMVLSVCPLTDVSGWNFVDGNDNLMDDRGHGTLVTLSYFHALDKLKPTAEIGDQSLLTVKVLNECGEGTTYSTICGLRYAELKGAKVINASWGMYQNDRQLQRAVEELNKKGIFIISSAGNLSLDLAKSSHFPSGYSSTFDYIVDEDKIVQSPGMNGVIEVGGICRYINTPCQQVRENTPLSSSSNFREVLFVEASKGIERLIPVPNRPSCEIEGTSYASPQVAAGVVHRLINGEVLTKEKMWSDAKQIHPDKKHKSYLLAKCQ